MNETISKIVATLFADIIETEETRALQQEINQNCQERYRDLVAGGLGEDDAIHAVVESLSGMEEALKDYPRRQAEQHMSGFDSFVCDSGDVKQIDVFTKAGNVRVEPSHDGQIHVLCEDEEGSLKVDQKDGVLTIQPDTDWGGDTISGTARRIWSQALSLIGGQPGILLQLPQSSQVELHITSTSGDLTVDGLALSGLVIRTTSGDAQCRCMEVSGGVRVDSTSGDLSFEGDCSRMEAVTISGDIRLDGAILDSWLKSTSGDINVCLPRMDSLNLLGKTVSGDARVSLPEGMAAEVICHTVSGDVRQYVSSQPGSPCRVELGSVSGDLMVR